MAEILDSEHQPIDCPELHERLSDDEIERRKREMIDFADSTKEHGKSRIYEEAVDRDRVAKRRSYFFTVPWNQ